MNTTISKGRNGWEARTIVPLERGEGYRLKVSTYKGDRGLVTYASTERLDGHFVTFRMFRDFHMTVLREPTRCTEKAVREQHQRALDQLADILAREAAWEAEQVAKAEADKRLAA